MPATRGANFWVGPVYEEAGKAAIDDLLAQGWIVAGITSASNSGGVWVMLVRPATQGEACPECGGSKYVDVEPPGTGLVKCPRCKGTGAAVG